MPRHDSDPILLCYDGSVSSLRAIEAAGGLFPGRSALVLHVWSPSTVMTAVYRAGVPSSAYDDSEVERAAVRLAEEGAALAVAAGLAATPAVASSRLDGTARTILNVAEEREVGLIGIGARGLSVLRTLVLGSVSHGVVQHAHCLVLVVPPGSPVEPVIAPIHAERAPVALRAAIAV